MSPNDIYTIAGDRTYYGTPLAARPPRLASKGLEDSVVDAAGNLYVADRRRHARIQRCRPPRAPSGASR